MWLTGVVAENVSRVLQGVNLCEGDLLCGWVFVVYDLVPVICGVVWDDKVCVLYVLEVMGLSLFFVCGVVLSVV